MKLRTLVTGLVAVALSMSVASCSNNDAQPVPATSTWPSGITEGLIKTGITDFMNEYKDCLANPPVAAHNKMAGNTVAKYCASHNSHAVANFSKAIAKNGAAAKGLDPVTCLKKFPDSFKVNTATVVKDTEGYGAVTETLGSKTQQVYFQVKMYSTHIQMLSNTCP